MSAGIYVLCGVVLVAGFALAWWLKREGERSWERHQALVRQQQQREAMARMTIVFRDNLTPKLQELGREMAKMQRAFAAVGEALSKGRRS